MHILYVNKCFIQDLGPGNALGADIDSIKVATINSAISANTIFSATSGKACV